MCLKEHSVRIHCPGTMSRPPVPGHCPDPDCAVLILWPTWDRPVRRTSDTCPWWSISTRVAGDDHYLQQHEVLVGGAVYWILGSCFPLQPPAVSPEEPEPSPLTTGVWGVEAWRAGGPTPLLPLHHSHKRNHLTSSGRKTSKASPTLI